MSQYILRFLFSLLLIPSLSVWAAESLSQFNEQQRKEFNRYLENRNKEYEYQSGDYSRYIAENVEEYEKWLSQERREYEKFRREVEKEWGFFVEPDRKHWVEYGSDRRSVGDVDFEKGRVTVRVLKKAAETIGRTRKKLEDAVVRMLSSKGGSGILTAEAAAGDTAEVLDRPVLDNQVIDINGNRIGPGRARSFAHDIVGKGASVEPQPDSSGNGGKQTVFAVGFPLASDHIRRRAEPYVPIVKKYCARYDLDVPHVMATIHTESYFNPMARSSSNAIGLMQLVPGQGGRDAYRFVYGTEKIPYTAYLYDPENNIELGCVYIHLLETQHFGAVRERRSNLYCTIAGYNCGPAGVANAFTGTSDIPSAITVINRIENPQNVYIFMIRHLRSGETRAYLKNVVTAMTLYGG